jgi:hypothetical protein
MSYWIAIFAQNFRSFVYWLFNSVTICLETNNRTLLSGWIMKLKKKQRKRKIYHYTEKIPNRRINWEYLSMTVDSQNLSMNFSKDNWPPLLAWKFFSTDRSFPNMPLIRLDHLSVLSEASKEKLCVCVCVCVWCISCWVYVASKMMVQWLWMLNEEEWEQWFTV